MLSTKIFNKLDKYTCKIKILFIYIFVKFIRYFIVYIVIYN